MNVIVRSPVSIAAPGKGAASELFLGHSLRTLGWKNEEQDTSLYTFLPTVRSFDRFIGGRIDIESDG